MAFARDTFTDADGTLLSDHVGEFATDWALHPAYTGVAAIDNGRLHGVTGNHVHYTTNEPSTAEYDVHADIVCVTATQNNGVAARIHPAEDTLYYAIYRFSTANWELGKVVAGAIALLGSWADAFTAGQARTVRLEVRDAAKKVFIDGVERISSADNVIAAKGRAGVRGPSGSATTGYHIDNFRAAIPGPTQIAVRDRCPPPIRVVVDDTDITDRAAGLTLSNVDPGGYEIATADIPTDELLRLGRRMQVFCGAERAWDGRVSSPSHKGKRSRGTRSPSAHGHGAALKDTDLAVIYADRSLERWGDMPLAQKIVHAGLGQDFGTLSWTHERDGLVCALPSDAIGAAAFASAWYVAPGDLRAARVAYRGKDTTIPGAWAAAALRFSTVDHWDASDVSDEAATMDDTDRYAVADQARKYVWTEIGGAAATPAGGSMRRFDHLVVYGDHGLPLRGNPPAGFYTSDIVRHALAGSGIAEGNIVDAPWFIVRHAVYPDPVPREQPITDMTKLMGAWHWGVWGPATILGDDPALDFCPPPRRATCVAALADCDAWELSEDLSRLYDKCRVAFTDATGTSDSVLVTIPNPRLPDDLTRTLTLNMGTGDAQGATIYAIFALVLAQRSARASGSLTLPAMVQLPGGGHKPACLLRAGLDRLQIPDVPDAGPLTEEDTRRFDTFHVRRVETTVGQGGVPATRVEFDTGADLLETLQARLTLASVR